MAVLLVVLLAAGAIWSPPAWSAPRFTDKDKALELAQVLDKGVFRGALISSTFVQSPRAGDYQIKVVLDNGAELNWNLDQIRLWSHDSSLTLSKNRALVFPDRDGDRFGVLDKNAFTRIALRSRVYAKEYREPDLLAGQVIHYGVHGFNLVELLGLASTRDHEGNRHRYVLDLENGQRELLTYLDAWRIFNRDGLTEGGGSQPVMRRPYRLTSIGSTPLKRNVEDGTGRFSVSLHFDRPVQLEPGHFPYRLFERKPGPGRTALDNTFVFEVTAPNAILPQAVNRIDALEFLYRVGAVADAHKQNRILMQAMIAPEVLTSPPEVSVEQEVVRITFTKVEDQSVFDRKALGQAELRRKQEKLLAPLLTSEDVERRRLFRQHMETGLGQLDKARAQGDLTSRFDILLAAISNFREAAIQASSDQELGEALRQRNDLSRRLPLMILRHAKEAANASGGVKAKVLEQLKAAQSLTRETKVLKALKDTEAQMGGN